MTQALAKIDHTARALAALADHGAAVSADEARSTTWGALERHFAGLSGQRTNSGPRSPYRQIAPVRAAVSRKAKALASMPLMISTADDQLVESGELFNLVDSPGNRMSRVAFWQTTSAWIDLSGACHWVFTDTVGDRPISIAPVSAWQMKPVFDTGETTGELVAWKYRPRGRRWDQAIRLDLDRVWTVGEDSFDPNEPFGYSSPLEAAGLAIAQIHKADLANQASLDNGVEPGGAFTLPGVPTESQMTDMRAQLEDKHAGVDNRRKPLLLYAGMEWKRIAASFDEMEFSTLQKMKIVDVCAALEVDPAAIGYYEDSNFAHAEAAKASLWIDTVLPRAEWLADEFTRGIVSRFEGRSRSGMALSPMPRSHRQCRGYRVTRASPGAAKRSLFVWFDSTRIPAIRKALLQRSKEGAIWIETYKATPADVIECLDLPIEVHPWQEHGWQKIGEMPIGEPLAGDNDPPGIDPAPGGEPVPGDGDGPVQAIDDDAAEDRASAADAERALTEAALAALWGRWRASWAGLERSARGRVAKHFMVLRKRVLANLDDRAGELGKRIAKAVRPDQRRDLIGEILFDLSDANDRLRVLVGPLVRESFRVGGQQATQEHADAQGGDAQPFDIADPEVAGAIRRRQIQLTKTNRTLRRRLAKQLEEGLSAQETVTEIADRIRREFNFANSRATTVARTEIGRGVEEARHLGRQQAGTPLKSWLWSRREKGRPWHATTERRTLDNPVPNDQRFTVAQTGNTCNHPRATGVAEDDINCGCTTIARFPGDSVKAVIDRYRARGFLTYERLQARDTRGKEAQ